jgi:hypothetical protein
MIRRKFFALFATMFGGAAVASVTPSNDFESPAWALRDGRPVPPSKIVFRLTLGGWKEIAWEDMKPGDKVIMVGMESDWKMKLFAYEIGSITSADGEPAIIPSNTYGVNLGTHRIIGE